MQPSNQGALCFWGVGYALSEVFLPVIDELKGLCRIYMLVADFCLSPLMREKLVEMKENKIIEEFWIFSAFPNQESRRTYHRRISSSVQCLRGLSIRLLVLGEDSQIVSRYIFSQFSDLPIKRVILQTGVIGHVLNAYRMKKALTVDRERKNGRISWLARKLLFNFRDWQNCCFFPYWYQKKTFPVTGYERLTFASGLCKHVICYDPLEAKAIQTTNPLVKYIYLARFPLEAKKSESQVQVNEWKKAGKLLVSPSGKLFEEMPRSKIDRWVEVTRQVVQLKNIREIHLRFHPRLSPALEWPKKIARAMEKLGCSVEIVNSSKVSLYESVHLYDGMIGSPSGSLRVTRALNKSMFILGLPNCCDGDFNDQPWLLGEGEGIQWAREGESVRIEQLEPPQVIDYQRPRVSSILLDFLQGSQS